MPSSAFSRASSVGLGRRREVELRAGMISSALAATRSLERGARRRSRASPRPSGRRRPREDLVGVGLVLHRRAQRRQQPHEVDLVLRGAPGDHRRARPTGRRRGTPRSCRRTSRPSAASRTPPRTARGRGRPARRRPPRSRPTGPRARRSRRPACRPRRSASELVQIQPRSSIGSPTWAISQSSTARTPVCGRTSGCRCESRRAPAAVASAAAGSAPSSQRKARSNTGRGQSGGVVGGAATARPARPASSGCRCGERRRGRWCGCGARISPHWRASFGRASAKRSSRTIRPPSVSPSTKPMMKPWPSPSSGVSTWRTAGTGTPAARGRPHQLGLGLQPDARSRRRRVAARRAAQDQRRVASRPRPARSARSPGSRRR